MHRYIGVGVVIFSLFYKHGVIWCILYLMLKVFCLFSSSLVDGHSLGFQFLASPNSAVIVFSYVPIYIHTFISIGLVPRSGSAELKSVCVFVCVCVCIYIYVYVYIYI